MALTGNTRYRIGWRRKLVLQVEYITLDQSGSAWNIIHRGLVELWRDATERDLFELEKLRRHHEEGAPYIPQAGYSSCTGRTSGQVPPFRNPTNSNPPPTYKRPPPPPPPPPSLKCREVVSGEAR